MEKDLEKIWVGEKSVINYKEFLQIKKGQRNPTPKKPRETNMNVTKKPNAP